MQLDQETHHALVRATEVFNTRTGLRWTEQEFLQRAVALTLGMAEGVEVSVLLLSFRTTLKDMLELVSAPKFAEVVGKASVDVGEFAQERVQALRESGDIATIVEELS